MMKSSKPPSSNDAIIGALPKPRKIVTLTGFRHVLIYNDLNETK